MENNIAEKYIKKETYIFEQHHFSLISICRKNSVPQISRTFQFRESFNIKKKTLNVPEEYDSTNNLSEFRVQI